MGASHGSSEKKHEKKVQKMHIPIKIQKNNKIENNGNISKNKIYNNIELNKNHLQKEKNISINEVVDNLSKETREQEKTDYSSAPDREAKEYEDFCKQYIFIENNDITVKVNEMFAKEFSINNNVEPIFQQKKQSIESIDEEIEFVERRNFYSYSIENFEDTTHIIYVFKAIEKGKFKINFSSEIINVNVI